MIAYAQPRFCQLENVEWLEADVDAAIPAVAGKISRLCGKIVSTTPCGHLYGVLCVTEFPCSQDSFAALTIH